MNYVCTRVMSSKIFIELIFNFLLLLIKASMDACGDRYTGQIIYPPPKERTAFLAASPCLKISLANPLYKNASFPIIRELPLK
jgi:hypothetical protein